MVTAMPRPLRSLLALGALAGMVAVGVAVHRLPPATGVSAPPTALLGSAADIELATRMLTTADHGGVIGHSLRWQGPAVTYAVEVHPSWTADFRSTIDDALAWSEQASGLRFIPVAAGQRPDLLIRGRDRRGGTVNVTRTEQGTIGRAVVELGCCSRRVAYEEVAQSLGVLADLGDDRSIFPDNRVRLEPSEWDRWVVQSLYRAPPRASSDQLHDALTIEAARRESSEGH